MNIEILVADYADERHGVDIGNLLNCYAADPMGGGVELDPYVKQNISSELSKIPHAFTLLCYVDDSPAGLINCFDAFSTFLCKPLVNIHDVIVVREFRGLGISQHMLAQVEEIAKAQGCCKITLEVLEGNRVARQAYVKFGFSGYELDPAKGKALFWQKSLGGT